VPEKLGAKVRVELTLLVDMQRMPREHGECCLSVVCLIRAYPV
jgi:hypothetical protein